MSDDLVKRLEKLASDMERHATEEWDEHETAHEAAARIRTLEAEAAAARECIAILAEADQRIAWESLAFGNEFAERVEAALAKYRALADAGDAG